MRVERDWYGLHWRELRSNLLRLCLEHGEKLATGAQNKNAVLLESAREFVDCVLKDISDRVIEDRLGLWENALLLFSDPAPLFRALKADQRALAGEKSASGKQVAPGQALGRILYAYLEQSRRQILADDLDVSPNRVKTWERLDHISRRVAQNDTSGTRCCEEHFEQLAEVVKAEHPNDRNLPRKVKTIMVYFYQFSDECKPEVGEGFDLERQVTREDALELLAGIGMETLMVGLQELSSSELEIVDVAYGLGVGVVQFCSIDDYLHTKGVNQGEFDDLLAQSIVKLRNSLETTINAQTGQVGAT